MKSIITLIIFILLFFYIADIKITISPFTFKINSLPTGIGWIFLIIGSGLISYDISRKAELKGFMRGVEELGEAIKSDLKKENKELKAKNKE